MRQFLALKPQVGLPVEPWLKFLEMLEPMNSKTGHTAWAVLSNSAITLIGIKIMNFLQALYLSVYLPHLFYYQPNQIIIIFLLLRL